MSNADFSYNKYVDTFNFFLILWNLKRHKRSDKYSDEIKKVCKNENRVRKFKKKVPSDNQTLKTFC